MSEPALRLDQDSIRAILAYATGEGDKYYYEIAAPQPQGATWEAARRHLEGISGIRREVPTTRMGRASARLEH